MGETQDFLDSYFRSVLWFILICVSFSMGFLSYYSISFLSSGVFNVTTAAHLVVGVFIVAMSINLIYDRESGGAKNG